MKKLHHSDFIANLKDDLTKAKNSLLIISPYITMPAVDRLLSSLPTAPLEKTVITLPFGLEYLTGAVELAALRKLEKSGFSLLSLNQLHSKIYVIDHKTAYIGSANFTGRGWGLAVGSNIEVMTKVTLSEADKVDLTKTYLDSGTPLDLPELLQMLSEGGELQRSYRQLEEKLNDFIKEKTVSSEPQNRYDAFLKQLKNKKMIASYTHEKNVKQFGKNVYHIKGNENSFSAKLMYSRRNAPLRTFDVDYNFELTKTGGDRAKRNNLDFLMILEGSEGRITVISSSPLHS